MKEKTLYPSVEDLLKSRVFKCFKTKQRVGTSFIGIADVVGVRDIGGDVCGDVEIIAVEVKMSTSNFGKILGQALGYSLFAHKCYLAVRFANDNSFSHEQKELATRLGVGLLEIKKAYNNWRCSDILTSTNHDPQKHQMETLPRRGLGITKCGFCGFFVEIGNCTTSLKEAMKNNRVYLSWRESERDLLFSRRREEDWRRVYICSDCIEDLKKVSKQK